MAAKRPLVQTQSHRTRDFRVLHGKQAIEMRVRLLGGRLSPASLALILPSSDVRERYWSVKPEERSKGGRSHHNCFWGKP